MLEYLKLVKKTASAQGKNAFLLWLPRYSKEAEASGPGYRGGIHVTNCR